MAQRPSPEVANGHIQNGQPTFKNKPLMVQPVQVPRVQARIDELIVRGNAFCGMMQSGFADANYVLQRCFDALEEPGVNSICVIEEVEALWEG
jgi:hypothetical protein